MSKKLDADVKMYGSVTINTKGQIVIPKAVRESLNLSEGEELMVMTKYGKLIALIKSDDMEVFIQMLQKESES